MYDDDEELNGIQFLVDIFKHVTSEQSICWLPNYEQNVNSIIRQVEDQKVEIKSLIKVFVVSKIG